MKAKMYSAEQVAQVATELASAPAKKPQFIDHAKALSELSKHIKKLHTNKNYSVNEIRDLLKEKGIKTTAKELNAILGNNTQTSRKKDTGV